MAIQLSLVRRLPPLLVRKGGSPFCCFSRRWVGVRAAMRLFWWFENTGSLATGRDGHTATLLPNG